MNRTCESCGSILSELTPEEVDEKLSAWASDKYDAYDCWDSLADYWRLDETRAIPGLGQVQLVYEDLANNENEGSYDRPPIYLVFKVGDRLFKKSGYGNSFSYDFHEGMKETHKATRSVEYYA